MFRSTSSRLIEPSLSHVSPSRPSRYPFTNEGGGRRRGQLDQVPTYCLQAHLHRRFCSAKNADVGRHNFKKTKQTKCLA